MISNPKISLVILHIFPGTTAQEAIDFAINMARGMSCATIRFKFNEKTVSVTHHSKTDDILRDHFPELFRRD